MRFNLYIDGNKIGAGELSIEENGSARMWRDEHRVLAVMDRVRIRHAGPGGMLLDGYEPHGCDKTGQPKYRHVEWLLGGEK